MAFFVAPTDAQQGEVYRIIFIHVPAAWMSMFIYVMAFWAALGLAFNTRLSFMMAHARADRGAVHLPRAVDRRGLGQADLGHLVGLGRAPHFRADAALPLPGLHRAQRRDRRPAPRRPPCGVLALAGAVNVPIIYFSVQWWNTLHQGASVSLTRAPTMAGTMLTGMLLMAAAFWMYSIAVALARVRCVILEREQESPPGPRAVQGQTRRRSMSWESWSEFIAMGGRARTSGALS